MPELSDRLALPFLLPSQAQKHVTHNEALRRLDGLVQLRIDGFDSTTPPAVPAPGETHALGAGASGAWAGQDGRLAIWSNGAWEFSDPAEGWLATAAAEGRVYVYQGGAWAAARAATDNLERVGINTTADAVNRLAVAAEATLLSHDGAGHQLKLNKSAPGETASLLYQSGWTGHAEIGLAGSNALSFKTSPDGTTWLTALTLDAATGHASGTAVQASATDTTPGRLARADHAFGPGNLLGTVSQAGGVPTGAVIEAGSNSSGRYVRFADGTQICWTEMAIGSITAFGAGTWADPWRSAVTVWTFPAVFADPPVVSGCPYEPSTSGLRGAIYPYLQLQPTNTTARLQVARGSSDATPDAVTLQALAIGRWL